MGENEGVVTQAQIDLREQVRLLEGLVVILINLSNSGKSGTLQNSVERSAKLVATRIEGVVT